MRFKSQEKLVTREDIKRFASEFDPQPYHLDEAAAEGTPFKGLAASEVAYGSDCNEVSRRSACIWTTPLIGPWRR